MGWLNLGAVYLIGSGCGDEPSRGTRRHPNIGEMYSGFYQEELSFERRNNSTKWYCCSQSISIAQCIMYNGP